MCCCLNNALIPLTICVLHTMTVMQAETDKLKQLRALEAQWVDISRALPVSLVTLLYGNTAVCAMQRMDTAALFACLCTLLSYQQAHMTACRRI
jgi:hypothetical protein